MTVTNDEWVTVYTASGRLSADMVRLLLESFGLSVNMSQESVGNVYGLTIGDLGEVSIQVMANQVDDALAILKAMEKGELEEDETVDENEDDETLEEPKD